MRLRNEGWLKKWTEPIKGIEEPERPEPEHRKGDMVSYKGKRGKVTRVIPWGPKGWRYGIAFKGGGLAKAVTPTAEGRTVVCAISDLKEAIRGGDFGQGMPNFEEERQWEKGFQDGYDGVPPEDEGSNAYHVGYESGQLEAEDEQWRLGEATNNDLENWPTSKEGLQHVQRDKNRAHALAIELLDQLNRMGDYYHCSMIERVVDSMSEVYGIDDSIRETDDDDDLLGIGPAPGSFARV